MNWKIFNASWLHIVLLGLVALAVVTATTSTPQKAYTKDELVMSCGKPFNFITVNLTHAFYEDESFPYTNNCNSWNFFDYPPQVNLLLYGIDVFIVFACLFGLVVVLPRLLGVAYHPFQLLDDGRNLRAILVPVVATALMVSTFYTLQINTLKIDADNDYFSVEEAKELVLRENPSLSEYRFDGGSKGIIFAPTGHREWSLQFVETKSGIIASGECYKVRSLSEVTPVEHTGSFREQENPVYKLDETCQPLL